MRKKRKGGRVVVREGKMREEGEEREKGVSVTKSTMATNLERLTYFKKTACSQKLNHHNADQVT